MLPEHTQTLNWCYCMLKYNEESWKRYYKKTNPQHLHLPEQRTVPAISGFIRHISRLTEFLKDGGLKRFFYKKLFFGRNFCSPRFIIYYVFSNGPGFGIYFSVSFSLYMSVLYVGNWYLNTEAVSLDHIDVVFEKTSCWIKNLLISNREYWVCLKPQPYFFFIVSDAIYSRFFIDKLYSKCNTKFPPKLAVFVGIKIPFQMSIKNF
jgi:hypothetical protein